MGRKPVLYSGHALFEMRRRGIRRTDVELTICRPGQVAPSVKGRKIYQRLMSAVGKMLLRVVVAQIANSVSCGDGLQDEQGRQVLEEPVKVIYDKESDTLSIILRAGKVAESDEARPGLILDYDKSGRLVSLELLDASETVHGPQSVEFALAAE